MSSMVFFPGKILICSWWNGEVLLFFSHDAIDDAFKFIVNNPAFEMGVSLGFFYFFFFPLNFYFTSTHKILVEFSNSSVGKPP